MSFTNYFANKVLNKLTGKENFAPFNLYIALGLTDSGEVANQYGYTRVGTPPSNWSVALDGVTKNSVQIYFPIVDGGDWGEISYFMLWDSGVYGEGNDLMHGIFAQGTIFVEDDSLLRFDIDDLVIIFD